MNDSEVYSEILKLIGSPLHFLALTALICSAAFSIGAGLLRDKDSFAYCIHMFLAIVGLFVLIAIWCPEALYHPRELEGLNLNLPHRPEMVTMAGLLGLASYMCYTYIAKRKR
jgi:hypothetical protein